MADKAVIHLVSDSTGETVEAAVDAGLAQFDAAEVDIRSHIFIRSAHSVRQTLAAIAAEPGPVFLTLVDDARRQEMIEGCRKLGVEVVSILSPIIQALARRLGQREARKPGKRHDVNADYFARIDAIEYAISHDDGASGDRIAQADVILTGVSRTSKTPTCIYLGVRGIKAANVPLIPGRGAPPELTEAVARGAPVVALTISPNRLAQIRAHRLDAIGGGALEDYAELDQIRREISEARLLFDGLGLPVVDVTRRSIEETAAAIIAEIRASRSRNASEGAA